MTIVNPWVRGFWLRSGMLFKLKFIVDLIEKSFAAKQFIAMAAKIGKNAQSVSEHYHRRIKAK
jgi:hypothetical protein